ncbi:MAG: tRNA lysidine(34) synthetase TilS [Acidimicrobiaceae bacterium]
MLRPLLECTRSQIRTYARDKGLSWREDHTNDTLDYTRNRVRKVVLPALEQALGASSLQGIHNAATHLRALRDAVEFLILPYRSAFSGDVSNASSGPIAIAIDPLKPLTMSLRALIIQHYLALSREDVGRLSELVDAEVGSRATLSQGMMALRDRASISVEERAQMDDVAAFTMEIAESRTCTHNGSVLDIELGVEPSQEYSTDVVQFDIKDVHLPLVWRTWEDGDRLAPFGMDGKTCLVSDVITNARIPHEQRRSMQVLTDSRGILWICGLRRSNCAPITENTTRVLRCRYRSPSS